MTLQEAIDLYGAENVTVITQPDGRKVYQVLFEYDEDEDGEPST